LDRTPAEGSNKIYRIEGRLNLDRRNMKDMRKAGIFLDRIKRIG
jgi:hypothetical protein